MRDMAPGRNRMRKKYERTVLVCLLVVFLLLLILLLLRGIRYAGKRTGWETFGGPGSGVELVIDPSAENAPTKGDAPSLEEGVVVTGRESLTLSAGTKEADVDFYNPLENGQRYYLTFELRLCVDGGQEYEVLYTSGLVEPGRHIYHITLSRELEKGEYEAVIHVQPYRMDEERTMTNNVDMRVRLFVKEAEKETVVF